MFDVRVTPEQYEYAARQVANYNFGQRGYGDGNRNQQLTGVIGQTVLADLIGDNRPDGADGFDGGKDFLINNKKVDIKTMSRTCAVRDNFVHNFVGYQKKYEVDYYVFASLNTRTNTLSICGYVDKDTFFERAKFFPKGSIRTRSDDTTFKTFAPLYEIQQTDLFPVNTVDELIANIK